MALRTAAFRADDPSQALVAASPVFAIDSLLSLFSIPVHTLLADSLLVGLLISVVLLVLLVVITKTGCGPPLS